MPRRAKARAGVAFEENAAKGKLEEVVAREAQNQPGALPLLEYALEMLYQEGHAGGLLTHEQYDKNGRVTGAVARKAEQTFAALPERLGRSCWKNAASSRAVLPAKQRLQKVIVFEPVT